MRYELIREIFNSCSNNQMRDISIEEVETDDPRQFIMDRLAGKEISIEENRKQSGEYVFDVIIANLHQRFTFSPE